MQITEMDLLLHIQLGSTNLITEFLTWFPVCSSILILPRFPVLHQKWMELWSYKIHRLHEIIRVNHDRESMKFLRGSLVSNQHCQTWDPNAIKCQYSTLEGIIWTVATSYRLHITSWHVILCITSLQTTEGRHNPKQKIIRNPKMQDTLYRK